MPNITEQFKQAMQDAGLEPPDQIYVDKFMRFPSKGKGQSNNAAWCRLFPEGDGGSYGDWSTDISDTWFAKKQYTPAERIAVDRQIAISRAQADQERKARYAAAASSALEIWKQAAQASEDHPYLKRKGIKPHGVKLSEGKLVIPIRIKSDICSLQFIAPDGEKRFLSGGQITGGYFSIGKPNDIICITEGFATGASVYEATGYAVAVAFNCGNLDNVTKAMRDKFPNAKLIVCADDDYKSLNNPGHSAANLAAQNNGGMVAIPSFGDNRPDKATDFNDMHQHCGLEAVKQAIGRAILIVQPKALITHKDDPDGIRARVIPLPKVTPDMLHGITGDFIREVTRESEINPAATGIAFISMVSACVGGSTYLDIGNEQHSPRIFSCHVGSSSVGGKGMAIAPVKRIHKALAANYLATTTTPLAARIPSGSLSSGEGLAYLIRDPDENNEAQDLGVPDKRLWIVEPEMGNVFAQTNRTGNTLSQVLRNCWDGESIGGMTKSQTAKCARPEIAVHFAITPTELDKMATANDIHNGFLNRFFLIFGERRGCIPNPPVTPEAYIQRWAHAIAEAIQFARDLTKSLSTTPTASKVLDGYYIERRKMADKEGKKVGGLTVRLPPYSKRLALLFALLDQSDEINEMHARQAIAWCRYAYESWVYVFDSGEGVAKQEQLSDLSEAILSFIGDQEKSQADLTTEFRHSGRAEIIQAALQRLVNDGQLITETLSKEGGGRRKQVFRRSSSGTSGTLGTMSIGASLPMFQTVGTFGLLPDSHTSENSQSSGSSEMAEQYETRMDTQCSETSESSERRVSNIISVEI
jgi:phage/plasmid primase-like uncharacterized protein